MSLSIFNRGRPVLVLAVVILALTPRGEATRDFLDPFEFLYNCQPMDLVVEQLSTDVAWIGLTEESIQAAVKSRLRSARLYDPDAPYLFINVSLLDSALNISLEYDRFRWRSDPSFNIGIDLPRGITDWLEHSKMALTWSESTSRHAKPDTRYVFLDPSGMRIAWSESTSRQAKPDARYILSRISKVTDLFLKAC